MTDTMNKVKEAMKKSKRALLDFEISFWLEERHTPGFTAYQIGKAVEQYMESIDEIDRMFEEMEHETIVKGS